MRTLFADEMKRLNLRFGEMGINTSEQIYRASKSYAEHDKELAKTVIEGDSRINDEEISLENEALELMALQQPMAGDFRRIITALKASSDLERVGDYAASIARETIRVKGNERIPEVEEKISEITVVVRNMMENFLDAYARDDIELAKKTAKMDLEVDLMYYQTQKLILGAMQRQTSIAVAALSYLSVVRDLERIGDHIVNLAEWVVYRRDGKLVELNPGKLDRDIVEKVNDGEKLDSSEKKMLKEAEEAAQLNQ